MFYYDKNTMPQITKMRSAWRGQGVQTDKESVRQKI